MAINKELVIPALPSIYSEEPLLAQRGLKIYYSTPEKGVNEDTGFLLYISGFRGYPTANVFKKLRSNFADDYNLVTVQCEFFGNEFMLNPRKIRLQDKHMNYFSKEELINIYKKSEFQLDTFLDICSNYEFKMLVREDLSNECPENFNEMGLMQAIDNLNALLYVMKTLHNSGVVFNTKKVIAYGNSHGAYLSHLCNILAPDLITTVIDNSGWIFPRHFFKDSRALTKEYGKSKIKFVFDYKAREIINDFDILDLENLYQKVKSKAQIINYHGNDDHLIPLKEKQEFINSIPNAKIVPISKENLNEYEGIFKDESHGLGANFITLFKHVMNNDYITFEKDIKFKLPTNNYIETDTYKYIFDYKTEVPSIVRVDKKVSKKNTQKQLDKMFKKSSLYKEEIIKNNNEK